MILQQDLVSKDAGLEMLKCLSVKDNQNINLTSKKKLELNSWLFSKNHLFIEISWAEWSLFSCSRFFAKWLFSFIELVVPLEARFNSDWCIAFLLYFCLRYRIFNSFGLEWVGLEDKNNSALRSEFFLEMLFLIKGRWFITFLRTGNPVPCCPNMHFPSGNRTYLNCSGWYRF